MIVKSAVIKRLSTSTFMKCPKIENNPALGPREKNEAQEYFDSLKELLLDLHSKGYIKKKLNPARGELFMNTIGEGIRKGKALNAIVNLVEDKDKVSAINEIIDPKKENIMANIWFNLLLGIYVNEVESFRVTFFQFLKQKQEISKGQTNLNDFIEYVRRISKKGDKALNSINLTLRNSISHGLVWYDKKVKYSQDANFSKVQAMSLYDFWKETKNANIINQAFLILIADVGKELFWKRTP